MAARDPEATEALLLSHTPRTITQVDDAWVESLARDLTEHQSTFTRNEMVQAAAARLGNGASMAHVERTAAAILASPRIVPVGDDARRWTSNDLLDVERRFLNAATGRIGSRLPIDPMITAEVLALFPTIGADQHAAVIELAGTSDAVSVLVS